MDRDQNSTPGPALELELDPHDALAELVAFAQQAYDRAHPEASSEQRATFRGHARERLAQIVQAYCLDGELVRLVGHGARRTGGTGRVPTERERVRDALDVLREVADRADWTIGELASDPMGCLRAGRRSPA